MTIGSTLPYYANGTQLYLPYADSARTLAYIHRKRPDFIVLQADELASRPYLRDWFEHSIPDSCARLIRHSEGPVVQQIEIYQWTCSRLASEPSTHAFLPFHIRLAMDLPGHFGPVGKP